MGDSECVTLQRTGRRWKYVIPNYRVEDLSKIQNTIFGRLYESGIVAIGTHQNKPCFIVTPFGKSTL